MSLSIEALISNFADHLTKKAEDVRQLAGIENSFEGWLKGEMCLAAARTHQRAGTEYAARLTAPGGGRSLHETRQKRVDVWVTVATKKHLYVELKVAFANGNQGKQLASWVSDAEGLAQLDVSFEEAEGAASVLVGVELSAIDVETFATEAGWPIPRRVSIAKGVHLWALVPTLRAISTAAEATERSTTGA